MSKQTAEVPRKYSIGGKNFHFKLGLAQDELMASLIDEMFVEHPEIAETTSKMIDLIKEKKSDKSAEEIENDRRRYAVDISINTVRLNTWILKKKYGRKILAILLTEEGKEFDEAEIAGKEMFMAKHAPRETVLEVMLFFFQRSVAFMSVTDQYSHEETTAIPVP